MRDAAEQLGLRAAALVAARPEPDLVRHQHGDATLADAVEQQERLSVRPLHQGLAARVRRLDAAIPWAPPWRALRLPSRQVGGDGMARAERADERPERALHDRAVAARRAGRQHVAERGRAEAAHAGEFRPDGEQQRAAAAHVVGDVAEIDLRQQPAVLEAVEDDEVELLDLVLEQLADREGDQRQLVERRHVVLLGRAQDGEMHEVDRRVRLQQPPPRALAHVGLARNEQDAQPIAHAVDLHDGAVVEGRDLAGERIGGELDDGGAGAGDRHLDRHLAPDRHAQRLGRLAVAAEGEAGGRRRTGHAEIVDRDAQHHGLADDPVGGRLDDAEPAVGLLALGGQQEMERRGRRGGGDVMHLAIGESDDAGEPRARDLGERPIHGREQARAVMAAFRHGDGAELEVGQLRGLRLDAGDRGIAERDAVAGVHRGGVVHHEEADIGQAFARLLHEARPGEPGEQHGEGEAAPQRAARAPQQSEAEHGEAEDAERAEHPEGQRRIEADRGDRLIEMHAYCPSRSRMAGTCTWSPL